MSSVITNCIADRSEVGQLFGLSWLITWFGHSIDRLEVIIRLFDVFMASSPTMPIYIGAAVSAELNYAITIHTYCLF